MDLKLSTSPLLGPLSATSCKACDHDLSLHVHVRPAMAELVALRQPGAWNLDNTILTSHSHHIIVGLRRVIESTWRGRASVCLERAWTSKRALMTLASAQCDLQFDLPFGQDNATASRTIFPPSPHPRRKMRLDAGSSRLLAWHVGLARDFAPHLRKPISLTLVVDPPW